MISTFSFPTDIRFGPGARKLVGDRLRAEGRSRPIVVTDRGVAGLPMFAEFIRGLGDLDVATFAEVQGNPDVDQVTDGVEALHRHGADSVIGFGGGAALDVAKAVALMANHPGQLFDYEDGRPDARPFDREIPFLVALPTTAGTGSEVGRSAVISDPRSRVKRIVFSPHLMARAVYADPELTLGLPPAVTAATGMDALTHCIEAYLAKDWHPLCDGIALEGVRLAAQHLERCVRAGADVEARGGMLMASLMGAVAFQKGLGITHSCAHALSAAVDMHHGLANGVMIDLALAHNIPAVPDRFARLADAAGLRERRGTAFIAWLRELKARIGIPADLRAAKVDPAQAERLADLAAADGCHQCNPRPCVRDDFLRIFKEALA